MAFKKKTDDGDVTTAPKRMPSATVRNRIAEPFGGSPHEIPLKRKDLVVRVVDAQLRAGRVHEMTRKGWEFVVPEDIAGTPEDFGFALENERLVRGERGREVLMKMHRADYDAIQMSKAAINTARLKGTRGKSAVLDTVAGKLGPQGDEAASYLDHRLTITDTREAVPLEDD